MSRAPVQASVARCKPSHMGPTLRSLRARLDRLTCMGLLDDAIREHLDLKRARGGDPAEIERLEREALGPVRREAPVALPKFDGPQDAHGEFFEPVVHPQYRPTDLEDLQDHGYHDSTAPHLHAHHYDAAAGAGELSGAQRAWEPERDDDGPARPEGDVAPRRRFLKRGRHEAERLPGGNGGAHDDARSYSDQAAGADRFFDHHEGPDDFSGSATPDQWSASPAGGMPPQLQFENPPKRPAFPLDPAAEVSSDTAADDWEASGGSTQPNPHVTDEPAFPAPVDSDAVPLAPSGDDAQETTEFDVPVQHADPYSVQEDVLEETPDFLQDTPEHDRLWFEQRPPKDFDFNG